MRTLTLQRLTSSDLGVTGVLIEDYKPILLTLERPWLDNKEDVSCIPAGQYLCERYNSQHFGSVFMVMDVPDRRGILVHGGNKILDTKGCILTGLSFDIVNDGLWVAEGQRALHKLHKHLDGQDSFILKVYSPRATQCLLA